jgi:uncharacterized phage protein (TIGR02218 family)
VRTIPANLQTHLNAAVTTTTQLLRIELANGTIFGLTSLDADVTYNDGSGAVTYVAMHGFDPSAIISDSTSAVDNAEANALISDDVLGITEEMVRAGALEDATWKCYIVNYRDLSQGHILLDQGDIGEVRVRDSLVWIGELLSFAVRLRQPAGHVWSRSCRATFGTPAAAQLGCGVNVAALWDTGTVLTVGAEPDRQFTGDLDSSSNWPVVPVPGRLRWTAGQNVGRTYSIESFVSGAVALNEPTPYVIEAGDEYEIRPDCGKRYIEDCQNVWNNRINFKGEPYIPVADSSSLQAPGGQLPGAGGWFGVDE